MHKTWNTRDQPEEDLRLEAGIVTGKQIEAGYKMIKKVSSAEDAKKIIDRIWVMKKWAHIS